MCMKNMSSPVRVCLMQQNQDYVSTVVDDPSETVGGADTVDNAVDVLVDYNNNTTDTTSNKKKPQKRLIWSE